MDDADADPMAAAIDAAPRGFQDIRALPVRAGGAVFFTHRVVHWGSASRAGYPTPRIACSWAATADDYEKPYFSRYGRVTAQDSASCREFVRTSAYLMVRLGTAVSTCLSRLRHCVRAYAPGSNSTTTNDSDRASTSLTCTTECSTRRLPSSTRTTRSRCKGNTSGLNLRWLGACKVHRHPVFTGNGSHDHATCPVDDRQKAPAQRKGKKRDDAEQKLNATAAVDSGPSLEFTAPLDLEEELQGMFGAVALGAEAEEGDEDFEESYWDGNEWVDGPPP